MPWSDLERDRAPCGIAFHRAGAGTPVVLLHGVGLRAESWRAQVRALASECVLYVPDLPGHGASAMLPVPSPAVADFTDAIARFLERGIGAPAVLAGHSMGAMIALDLAVRYPHLVRGVAALNAVYRRTQAARQAVLERAHALGQRREADPAGAPVARWFGEHPHGAHREAAEACRRWLGDAPRDGYAAAYRAFAGGDAPADEALAALAPPALFLTGSEDANSTAAMSRNMAALAPQGAAVVVEGAGHMAQMTHPDAVTTALAAWIRRALAAAPGARENLT